MSPPYSVSFRLQRIITESAHVSVPISEDLWEPNPDDPKTMRLNAEKLASIAVQYGNRPSTNWLPDGDAVIQLHPLQTPPDQR